MGLFLPHHSRCGGYTLPFLCLRIAGSMGHEGEGPMAIRWRLQRPIPGAFYPELAVAV
ncbi:hypothetical protein [Synechococcus sp. 1G10]|uniref:hypothetical protein n=1 Tax=Synechococcus sp. 1G10 TaxID=2025605 RepID=UPI0018E90DB8|nr:hypothetical protein [Synechococcus sp. 1G10]